MARTAKAGNEPFSSRFGDKVPVVTNPAPTSSTTATCKLCGKLVRLGGAMSNKKGEVWHQACPVSSPVRKLPKGKAR